MPKRSGRFQRPKKQSVLIAGKRRFLPLYRPHTTRNVAFVESGGRRHYLPGPVDSRESIDAYHAHCRMLQEQWQREAKQRAEDELQAVERLALEKRLRIDARLFINELCLKYLEWAEDYYADRTAPPDANGKRPCKGELNNLENAIDRLVRLYGMTPAEDFDSVALEAVQQAMIQEGCSRGFINDTVNRLRRVFRWGVRKKLFPPMRMEELRAVEPLRAGFTDARETEPVRPVPDDDVEAVLPFLSRTIAAMVRLQRLTGMRPGEVCNMRGVELDRSGEVWLYEPRRHKTSHRGKRRSIPLGPKAQLVLRGFLKADPAAYLFSPRDAVQERAAELRAKRKTRVQPSQQNRKKARPKRQPREKYDANGYRYAIQRGIARCNKQRRKEGLPDVPSWFPYQLRHAFATDVRNLFGEEHAQVGLGHSRMDTTSLYGERNLKKATAVAREIG